MSQFWQVLVPKAVSEPSQCIEAARTQYHSCAQTLHFYMYTILYYRIYTLAVFVLNFKHQARTVNIIILVLDLFYLLLFFGQNNFKSQFWRYHYISFFK